jgi:gluconate kinase
MPDQVDWIYLRGSFSLIKERMKQRKDHFMPEKLLVSQFETLEEPLQAMVLDIEKSPEELLEKILGFYQK